MEEKKYVSLLSGSMLFRGFTEKEIREIYDGIMPHARTYKEDEALYFEGDVVRRFGVLFTISDSLPIHRRSFRKYWMRRKSICLCFP